MGNSQTSSRVLMLDDIQAHLTQCTQLHTMNSAIYGDSHYVRYQGMEFYITKSIDQQPPSHLHLHYLIPPNLLVVPNMTLLENAKPENYEQLIELMGALSRFLKNQKTVYIGRKRIGFANRWGLVGQKQDNWPYQQVLHNRNAKGIYLSPTLIQQLSHSKQIPVHDSMKSDIFALGIMLIEIIFSQDLSDLFNYTTYQIMLKPLLEKLSIIRKEFGDPFYSVLLKMLELEEKDRMSFIQFHSAVIGLSRQNQNLVPNSNSSRKRPIIKRDPVLMPSGQSSRNRSPRPNNKSPDRLITPNQSKSPFSKDLRIKILCPQNRSPRIYNQPNITTRRPSFNGLCRK